MCLLKQFKSCPQSEHEQHFLNVCFQPRRMRHVGDPLHVQLAETEPTTKEGTSDGAIGVRVTAGSN